VRDPQTSQFRKRLKRIDRIHRKGGGFEADGTLGQSFYTRQRRRGLSRVLRPILYMAGAVILTKAFLVADLGLDPYLERVANLENGSGLEQAGALLMRVDPVSLQVASLLAPLFG